MQIQDAGAAVRGSQQGPVQPDPKIAQQQGNADKQQAQRRVAGGGFTAGLTQLPVAGFDTEAIAVDREQPLGGVGADAPAGIQQGLACPAATTFPPRAAMHPDADGSLAAIGAGERVGRLTAVPPQRKDPRAAWPVGMSGFPSAEDHRHEKGIPGRLQVTNNGHTVEAAIEQQQGRPHPGLAGAA